MLIRVGDKIINLDSVLMVDLNYTPDEDEDAEPQVVFEFQMRGWDELDEGANVAQPYLKFFEGEEAEAIRRYFKRMTVDLVATE
jgi:hypothetical protein